MIPEVQPSQRVWEAIVRALPGGAANDNRVRDLSRQVRRWRLATAGAGLVAAGLGLFVALSPRLLPPSAPPAGARYVAVVTSGGALPALIVNIDTATGTASVRPVSAETPAGRSLQLWYVGTGEAPKPLGLIGADASRIPLPDAARTGQGVFAVSVEPPGGSPTAAHRSGDLHGPADPRLSGNPHENAPAPRAEGAAVGCASPTGPSRSEGASRPIRAAGRRSRRG